MPTPAARRIGIVVVLILLAGAAVLAILPGDAGTIRLGGLSLLWWYAVVAAPAVCVAVTAAALSPRRQRRDPAHAPPT